jgi:hypothetical protein
MSYPLLYIPLGNLFSTWTTELVWDATNTQPQSNSKII